MQGKVIFEPVPQGPQKRDTRYHGFKLHRTPPRVMYRIRRVGKKYYVLARLRYGWWRVYRTRTREDAIDYYCKLRGLSL